MKRVLVFSDEYPPSGGGAGTVAAQLVADLVGESAQVQLLSGDDAPTTEPHATHHYRVTRKTLVWPFAYRQALRGLDLDSFDLIVLNDFAAAYLAGLWFSVPQLAKSVVIVHGEDSRYVFQQQTRKHRVFFYRPVYRRLIRHCRSVVAVSAYAQQVFAKSLPPGLNPRLEYCYAGIALDRMPIPTMTRQQLELPDQGRVLLSVSRLVEEKGLLDMLSLFEQALADGRDYHWLIAGDGPLKQDLIAAVHQRGLGHRVRVLGRRTRADLANYFAAADVFWLLSRATYETMGLVYLEAAFYGTPSIGLRQYGVIEAIDEGVSGYFHSGGPISDLVERCIAHLDPATCRTHATRFSSARFARHLLTQSRCHSGP